jgi:hypothetical protein
VATALQSPQSTNFVDVDVVVYVVQTGPNVKVGNSVMVDVQSISFLAAGQGMAETRLAPRAKAIMP